MPNPQYEAGIKPFIGSTQRHDLVAKLARTRQISFDEKVNHLISVGLDPEKVKLDGKNGGLDGIGASSRAGAVMDDDPWSPWQPPKFPKGKETKEGKESKDGKESKEGKESKDSKEGKDTSDGGNKMGDDGDGFISRFGRPEELNWSAMNQIAKAHGMLLGNVLQGKRII